MNDLRQGWKILTHDFRPPIQGGNPVFTGTFPATLPKTFLDVTLAECAPGWNYTASIEAAFRIAGLWRTGRPNAIVRVEASPDALERVEKRRASQLTLQRFATPEEIRAALVRFSVGFGAHQDALAEEQWLWYEALGRPLHDKPAVEDGLRLALRARNLPWKLKEYPTARDARAARDAWAAWDAWDAWDARAARDAWAAWAAWAARDARAARDAWAAWAAWDAWDAWAARDALTVEFAARSGWITTPHNSLTLGIRGAYRNGLAIALPTGPDELGWAMEPEGSRASL